VYLKARRVTSAEIAERTPEGAEWEENQVSECMFIQSLDAKYLGGGEGGGGESKESKGELRVEVGLPLTEAAKKRRAERAEEDDDDDEEEDDDDEEEEDD
jgi:hypothetical protein